MGTHLSDHNRGDARSPTPPDLLGSPLDFLYEDHLREREICALLDGIVASGTSDPENVAEALSFLREELPLHLEDEEQDLFPLLRRRCAPEDEIERAITRLTSDHRHAEQDTAKVIAILSDLETGPGDLADEARGALADYAVHARRHLILENAIILRFARLRLTESDLQSLCLRMMQRRGLDRLMETCHAQ
ncbi:MAG: hemerythrin domain-containing protein [Rhodobacteraceae bacterium]|nr:hemerythrin domain-containing protein [Paracoccaceae bacterium]